MWTSHANGTGDKATTRDENQDPAFLVILKRKIAHISLDPRFHTTCALVKKRSDTQTSVALGLDSVPLCEDSALLG